MTRANRHMHQADDARSTTQNLFDRRPNSTTHTSAQRSKRITGPPSDRNGPEDQDLSEEQALAARVAEALEADEHIPSLAAQHDTAGMMAWRAKKSIKPEAVIALPRDLNFAAASVVPF